MVRVAAPEETDDERTRRLHGRYQAVAAGQDADPGPGAGAVAAGAARRARPGKGRRDRAAGLARLVAAVVRRDRRKRRGQPAAQMGGDAHRAGRRHRAGGDGRNASGTTRRRWNSTSRIAGSRRSFARSANPNSARCWSARPISISLRLPASEVSLDARADPDAGRAELHVSLQVRAAVMNGGRSG